jgi:superfamily I DNA/RNA helicase
MVQLIPAKLEKPENVGERLIFDALKRISHVNPDWVVLHSLKQVKVLQKNAAETDFLVLIPNKGIVVVEAKGATAVDVDGESWKLEGVPKATQNKNPFTQIDNATRNIQHFLKVLGYENKLIPFARLAWFPKIDATAVSLKHLGMAIHQSEFAYKKHVEEPIKSLNRVIDAQIKRAIENPDLNYDPSYLTAERIQHISEALLPKVSMKVSLDEQALQRKLARRKATEEQILILELVAKNQHIYFEGAAGTGKTEILKQIALDLRRNSREVLYVCYNVMLADHIYSEIGGLANLEISDINSLLLKIVGLKKNPAKAGNEWFETELPEKALLALKSGTSRLRFDAICVDEFQDIASRPVFFQILKELRRTTLMQFKFLLAGDDQQQIAGNGIKVDSFNFAKTQIPDLIHVSLNTNCRQSPKLAKQIAKTLNMEEGTKRHRLADDEPGTLEIFKTTEDRQANDLAKVVNKLLESYRPQDIRILSVYGAHASLMAKLFDATDLHSKELRELRSLLKHPESKLGKLSWRSIGKYKGLEQDVVVLTDISQKSKDWLAPQGKSINTQVYVGLTRARTHAVMLVQDGLFDNFAKKLD